MSPSEDKKPTEDGDEPEKILEEEEVRPPIYLNVTEFSQNGLLTLKSSEDLVPIGNLTQINLNISDYFILSYTCMGDSEDSLSIPTLFSYELLNSTATSIVFKLNFTDPLYVSSFGMRDRLSILVIGN